MAKASTAPLNVTATSSRISTESTVPPVSATSSRKSEQFFRFFSTDSSRSNGYVYGEIAPKPQWDHSFCSIEFLLKLAQVLMAIICTGLYSRGMTTIIDLPTTTMLPNVIFSAFIIITSVIIMSYVLGHIMPEVLIRIFNSLGTILYFVSAAITGQYWLFQGRFEPRNENKLQELNMLLAETVLSFVNAFLYGIDVYFSMKRTQKKLEICEEITTTSPPVSAASSRKSAEQIFRFFSTDSSRSSAYVCGEIAPHSQWDHNFCSKEFLLKVAQVVMAIIGTGLYSRGITVIISSITTVMFPNVVFSSFIIITSVIIMSYIMGHLMPEVLIRIFNSLGTILYFVSAAITGQYWLVQGRFEAAMGDRNQDDMNMLLAETILSFFNAFLYGIDVYFSMDRTLKSLEIPVEVNNEKDTSRRQSKV